MKMIKDIKIRNIFSLLGGCIFIVFAIFISLDSFGGTRLTSVDKAWFLYLCLPIFVTGVFFILQELKAAALTILGPSLTLFLLIIVPFLLKHIGIPIGPMLYGGIDAVSIIFGGVGISVIGYIYGIYRLLKRMYRYLRGN